jgi:hypothetical protein
LSTVIIFRVAADEGDGFERRGDLLPREREVGLDDRALAREGVDDRKSAEPAAVVEPVGDEVHAPPLVRSGRCGRHHAEVAAALPALLRAYCQAFLAVQPVGPLVVHLPALRGEA